MKFFASVIAAALLASTAMSHAQAAASPAPAATPTENTVNLPKPECEIDYGQWMDNLTKEARDAGVGERASPNCTRPCLSKRCLIATASRLFST